MLRLSRLLAILLLTALLSSTASAQKEYTYTPTGTVLMKAGNGSTKTKIVSITNTTNQTTFLKIRFFGDTNFKFNYTQTQHLWIGADSTANFTVTYKAAPGDTSYGYLRMYDSVHTADTIKFIGIDTGEVYNGPAWKVTTTNFNAGSYYGRPETLAVNVRNYLDESVTVSSSILTGSYGFTALGSQQKTIAAGNSTNFLYWYDSGSYNIARASVLFSGVGIADTVFLRGQTYYVPPSPDTLTFDGYHSFGVVPRGDSVCRDFVIVNKTDSAVSITEFGFDFGNPPFYMSNPPSLPLLLQSDDSVIITLCFRASETPADFRQGLFYFKSGADFHQQEIFLWGMSDGCIHADRDTVMFGAVAHGSEATSSVTISNVTTSYATIDSAYFMTNESHTFALNTALPFDVAPNGSTNISVSYTGSVGTPTNVTLVLVSQCSNLYINLSGYVDTNTLIDTTAYELFGDSTQTIEFVGDSSFARQVFSFINDLNDSLIIKSVSLKEGTHFEIYDIDPQYPELTLAPNDIMNVALQFVGNPGTYDDTLVIVTEFGFVALNFPIHGIMNGSAVPGTPVGKDPELFISPNPSDGPVNIVVTNAHNVLIEVLDVMGRQVARFDDENISWGRNNASSGTYFVRASGIGPDMKPFVITSRIVLQ
jgi:hypothetical protein